MPSSTVLRVATYEDGTYIVEGAHLTLRVVNVAFDLDREVDEFRESDLDAVRAGKSHILTALGTRFVPSSTPQPTEYMYVVNQLTAGLLTGTSRVRQAAQNTPIESGFTSEPSTFTCKSEVQMAPTKQSSSAEAAKVLGKFEGQAKDWSVTLTVSRPSTGGLSADVSTGTQGCFGEMEHAAVSESTDGRILHLTVRQPDSEKACTVVAEFDPAFTRAKLTESECGYFHGGGCRFDGEVLRTTQTR